MTAVNVSNRARGALDQLEFGQLALNVLLRCCVSNTVSLGDKDELQSRGAHFMAYIAWTRATTERPLTWLTLH